MFGERSFNDMNEFELCPRFKKAVSILSQRWTALILYVGFGDDLVGKVRDEGEEEDEEGKDGEEPGVGEGSAPTEELIVVHLGPDAAGEGDGAYAADDDGDVGQSGHGGIVAKLGGGSELEFGGIRNGACGVRWRYVHIWACGKTLVNLRVYQCHPEGRGLGLDVLGFPGGFFGVGAAFEAGGFGGDDLHLVVAREVGQRLLAHDGLDAGRRAVDELRGRGRGCGIR